MMRIPKALRHDVTLRLVHDLSPEENGITPLTELDISQIYNNLNSNKASSEKSSSSKQTGTSTKHRSVDAGLSPKETILLRGTLDDIYNLGRTAIETNGTVSQDKNHKKDVKSDEVKYNNDINQKYHCYEKTNPSTQSKCDVDTHQPDKSNHERSKKPGRRPRKLPEIPKHQNKVVQVNTPEAHVQTVFKSLADELQEALRIPEEDNDVFDQDEKSASAQCEEHGGFSRYLNFHLNSTSKNTKAFSTTDNVYIAEDSCRESRELASENVISRNSGLSRDQGSCESRSRSSSSSRCDSRRHCSSGSSDSDGAVRSSAGNRGTPDNVTDLVVTHRGMHRFIPRHRDEIEIEIGDAIHVYNESEDSWCEGCNLRTKNVGIFPSMYATNLRFLEEDDEEDDGCSKFNLRFLGSVEVNYHKGNDVLCQAINRVALMTREHRPSKPPPQCVIEISQYGIRMMDKSQEGHQKGDSFSNFFALKNISFCGFHPRNQRYFAFITKHPKAYRFACHVFLGERSTLRVSEAIGRAFERFQKEYMAFTHPTEDIYME